jgi:hypothetical protein
MLDVLRRTPALVGLLVALLSLSLTLQIAQPTPAAAAEPESPVSCDGSSSACSPWVAFRNDDYDDGGLYWQKCGGSARWVASSNGDLRIELANLKCRGFSPAKEALHNSEGDATLTLGGCSPAHTQPVSWLDGDGANYMPRVLTSPVDQACIPTRWEVSIESGNGPLPSNTIKDGGPLTLPAAPTLAGPREPGTCPHGTPQTASVTSWVDKPGDPTRSLLDFAATADPALTADASDLWRGGFIERWKGNPEQPPTGQYGWNDLTRTISPLPTTTPDPAPYDMNHPAAQMEYAGVQFYYQDNGWQGVLPSKNYPGAPIAGTAVYGVTDPARCLFWFGPKVWNDGNPDSHVDDPWLDLDGAAPGGVPDSPAPDPVVDDTPAEDDVSACHFDVTDPSSWLEAGMCAVVGILKLIWETLGDVLGAVRDLFGAIADLGEALADAIAGIAEAILDGLEALFVPSESALTAGVNAVKQAWAESSPGQYLSAFGGIASAFDGLSAGGCEGPRLQASTGLGDIDVRPFQACDGTMATIAGIVKIALAAGVYLGAGVIAVRVIGASFGLNLNGLGREGGNE